MKLEEIPEYLRNKYRIKCKCGTKYTILTQRDNAAEYETQIYLLCECDEYVEFILPVN